jgi:NAD(P)-dependent dehydrogenase (short-subunit alcohol dehydrogenase family)
MLLENKNAVIYGGGGSIGGAVDSNLALDEGAYQGLLDSLDQMRMTRRSPRLAEVAATAAFLASEKAGAITGTFVNVTSGTFPS